MPDRPPPPHLVSLPLLLRSSTFLSYWLKHRIDFALIGPRRSWMTHRRNETEEKKGREERRRQSLKRETEGGRQHDQRETALFFSEHFHEVDEWQLLCHWLDGILLSSPPACCLEQAGRRGSRNRQSFRRRRGSHHRSVDHYSSLALVHGGVKHKKGKHGGRTRLTTTIPHS